MEEAPNLKEAVVGDYEARVEAILASEKIDRSEVVALLTEMHEAGVPYAEVNAAAEQFAFAEMTARQEAELMLKFPNLIAANDERYAQAA